MMNNSCGDVVRVYAGVGMISVQIFLSFGRLCAKRLDLGWCCQRCGVSVPVCYSLGVARRCYCFVLATYSVVLVVGCLAGVIVFFEFCIYFWSSFRSGVY